MVTIVIIILLEKLLWTSMKARVRNNVDWQVIVHHFLIQKLNEEKRCSDTTFLKTDVVDL